MKDVHYRDGQIDAAVDLVKRYHYSRRAPGNVQLVVTAHEGGGLFNDFGRAWAACFFSIPPTRWAEPVIELSRLVRDERKGALTGLISFGVKVLRRRGVDLVVSFADKTQGHHGGIYQAASWNYNGARESRMDGVIINNVFYPGRSCNSKWGTQSPEKLSKIIGQDVHPHFDDGKHLYWKALTKNGEKKAARLNLIKATYVKPIKNLEGTGGGE